MSHSSSLIDDLERVFANGTAEQRADILAQLCDLFVAGDARYTEPQVNVFDDLFLDLTSRIETKALAQLSSRLADLRNAPMRTVRGLSLHDDVAIAGPILARSQQLTDADLCEAARTKSQDHLMAISGRLSLAETVTDVLLELGGRDIVHRVATNRGARFSDAGFRNMVRRSKGDDALATQVGLRRDLPSQHLFELIEQASAAVRDKLTAANPAAAAAVRQILAKVTDSLHDQVREDSTQYSAAKERVAALRRSGGLTEEALYNAARARRFEDTAVMLATVCRVPLNMVERALTDRRRELLLILAKVAGLSWTVTKAILMMQVADRGMSAQDLDQAMNNFAKLQVDTARRVIGFYNVQRDAMATTTRRYVAQVDGA